MTATRGRPLKIRPEKQAHSEDERQSHQKAIGDRLKEQRELRGYTPADLAHKAGITTTAVRDIELGKVDPKTWTVKVLAKALGCPAGWLAFGG